jgi:4-diphosphocytidyl-2-C-methyl-D-erythritol kinase
MTARRSVRVRAPAKINLTLRVLALRDDGYHELRTVFQSLALHDTLVVTLWRGDFSLECDDPSVPDDASNLVWRAAEKLWAAAGRRGSLHGVRIALGKKIPAQAGLGGGSSDAAATLRALVRLWRVALPETELHAVARDLGADVPYFLTGGGAALGVDRGDLLFPLADRPRQSVVIVRPDFGVSTRDAYAWWDAERHRPARLEPVRWSDGTVPASEWRNDLEPPVVARHPEISRLIGDLRRCGAVHAAMSGSGSAVFGLFDRETTARKAAGTLDRPGRLVLTTTTVDRRRYGRLTAVR